jgi:HD-GYP domain-containing protein (c-di-GMP phosphodiesterase class II)
MEVEFNLIQSYPQVSYDLLKRIRFQWPVAQIVLQHNERPDGSGHPNGLKGDDILLEARVIAVADVVEAMFSNLPYRPALGIDNALDEISMNRRSKYDANAVDACLKLFGEGDFRFEK